MRKFIYPPDQASYVVTDGQEVLATQLDGGRGRYRKDIINASASVSVTWTFSVVQFEYFRAFLKGTAADRGSKPFLLDLILDEALNLTEHEVYFVPGTIKTAKVQGHMVQVQATIEAIPLVYEDGYFDMIVLLVETWGEQAAQQAPAMFTGLHYLVNVQMPSLEVFDGD